jgi:hypothetical protein
MEFAMKFSKLFCIVMLFVLLASSACNGIGSFGLMTAEETVGQAFDVPSDLTVVVETFNGSIDAVAGGGGKAGITVTKRGSGATQSAAEADLKNVIVSMVQDGYNKITITIKRAVQPNTGNSGGSVKLTLPADAKVQFTTSNGAISTTGISGDANVHTSNGSLILKGVAGRVDAETSNGKVDIDAAKAVSVNASTSNGEIIFKGALTDAEQTFRTSNGRIRLALPADAKFRINATTSNGKVTTDYAVTTSGTMKENRLEGTVGDNPSITVRAETSNGAIDITKMP